MAFDEEAKAVQEVAKATQQAIGSADKLGGFMARFIEGPLEAASGVVTDRLQFMRWERKVRFMARAQDILKEVGLNGPTRRIPMNVAIPLLEAATLEEDDELQDTWARLLVNAANVDSKVEVRRTFVSILQDMGALEARILDAVVNAPASALTEAQSVPTVGLPDNYILPEKGKLGSLPPHELQVALWNLVRLGCITPELNIFGGLWIGQVYPTALGRDFVQACTIN